MVDDEEAVRTFLRDVLSGAGFDVLKASNGKHAIQICNRSQVDLIVTDLVMQESEGGIETIQAIRRILPNAPAIAMSGMWAATSKRHGASALTPFFRGLSTSMRFWMSSGDCSKPRSSVVTRLRVTAND